MSLRTSPGGLPRRFRVVQQSFLQRDDLAFAEVLSEQDIQAAFDAEGVTFAQEPGNIYTPTRKGDGGHFCGASVENDGLPP